MKRTTYALILALLAGMFTFGGVSAQVVLEVGDEVIVQGGPLELFIQPGGGTRLTEMPDGTVTKIVAGPEMVNGVAWWYISNNYGWVVGERDGQAALVPFDTSMLEQTIAEASAAIASDSDNADAYFRRGWAYFNQQNYDSAISDLTQAITLESDNPALYHARGKIYLDDRQYQAALDDLAIALLYDPTDVTAYNRRGVAYDNLFDYQRAAIEFSTALQLAPDYGLIYQNIGSIAIDAGNYSLALDYSYQALEIDPYLYDVYINMGYANIELRNYEIAHANFEQYLEYYPDKYNGYAGLGVVYEMTGALDQALDYYNQALEREASSSFIYRSRGRLYYKLSRFEEAIADFDQAINYAADPASEYNTQGSIYLNLRDYPAAIERYTRSAELGGRFKHWALYNRGLAHSRLGEYDAALADYEAALRVQVFPAPYIQRSVVLTAQGKYYQSLENINQTIEMFPYVPEAYYQRARLYSDFLPEPTKALEDLQYAAALNPNEDTYYLVQGEIYMSMGLNEQAIATFEQYLNLARQSETTEAVADILDYLRSNQETAQANSLEPIRTAPLHDFYNTKGHVLYWQFDETANQFALYIVDPAGKSLQITPYTSLISAVWSPDGQRIAFSNENGIYLVTPDGANLTKLADAFSPTTLQYSPDGSKIAYVEGGHIWVVTVHSGQKMNVTAAVGQYLFFGSSGLRWSPDGQHIIFTAERQNTISPNGIYQIKVDGTGMSTLVYPFDHFINMREPRLSPDGSRVAFLPQGDSTNGLWVISTDHKNLIKLIFANQVTDFDWSLDSEQIIYGLNGAIYLKDLDSRQPAARLVEGVLDWQTFGEWLPDGDGIMFTACREGTYSCEIFTSRLDGSELRQLTDSAEAKMYPLVSPLVE